MDNPYSRLNQALRDLVESYSEIEDELEQKFTEDEDSFASAVIEALEGALESAVDELGVSTNELAGVVANITEALEQLDPSAFDEDENDDYVMEDVNGLEDYDMDDDEDLDDLD